MTSIIFSEKIKVDLIKLTNKYFPHINLNLIFTNKFSIASFFKHKEKLAEPLCSSVIYQYKCMFCDKHYIGSTARQLSCRIAEHRGVSVRTGQPLSNKPNSSIFQHETETGHRVLKSNFKIIAHSNKTSLRTLEALYIFKNKPELNCGLPVELSLMS